MVHSIRKEMKKNNLRFDSDMYTHPMGSIIISACILTGRTDVAEINRKWRNLKKHPKQVDFWIDDEKFIDKTLALFDMERPEDFPIAMVQSDFNVLFLPCVDGQLFPLREDGVFPQTARKGKAYPIVFTNNDDNSSEEPAISEDKDNAKG